MCYTGIIEFRILRTVQYWSAPESGVLAFVPIYCYI